MSDENVVDFPGAYYGEIEPVNILEGALAADLDCVIVVGKTRGGEDYFASSMAYYPDIYWRLCEAAKKMQERGLKEEEKDGQ